MNFHFILAQTASVPGFVPEAVGPYWPYIVGIVSAVIILIVGKIIAGIVEGIAGGALRKMGVEESLSRFLSSIAGYLVFAFAVISALGQLGVETTSIVAILASAGLAVGLALQGSLSNFAAGVMILFFKPFKLGDKIEAAGHVGNVEDIGIFVTSLITLNKERIIVPNSAITAGSITNFNTEGILRGEIPCAVPYGTDVKAALDVVTKAAAKSGKVLSDPAPDIALVNLGASGLEFMVMPYCNSNDYLDMLHETKVHLYSDLSQAGFGVPFQRVIVDGVKA